MGGVRGFTINYSYVTNLLLIEFTNTRLLLYSTTQFHSLLENDVFIYVSAHFSLKFLINVAFLQILQLQMNDYRYHYMFTTFVSITSKNIFALRTPIRYCD